MLCDAHAQEILIETKQKNSVKLELSNNKKKHIFVLTLFQKGTELYSGLEVLLHFIMSLLSNQI